MKYILSGGGTGGHIYPALAIATELKNRDENNEILYVGKKGSLEEELVTKAGFDFSPIHVEGLPRKALNKQTITSAFALLRGLRDSKKIIKNFKPDVVIGTGGYVCAPIVYKAQKNNIKTVVQEQNAFPGKTNRFLAKNADLVAINFNEAKEYLNSKNIIFTGNPIRNDFKVIDKEKAAKDLNIELDKKIVLSFGGSGGQESTNEAIIEILKNGMNIDFKLIHITGKPHYDYVMDKLKDVKISENTKLKGKINGDEGKFVFDFTSPNIIAYENTIENVNIEIDNKNPLYNAYITVDSIKNDKYKIADFNFS